MCSIIAVGLPASKSQPHRRAVLAGDVLTIALGRDTRDVSTYRCREIAGVPFPARGFQLDKVAGGSDAEAESYAVLIDPSTHSSCECRGFLRWGSTTGPCKHIAAVAELLAEGAFDPAPAFDAEAEMAADPDYPNEPWPSAEQLDADAA